MIIVSITHFHLEYKLGYHILIMHTYIHTYIIYIYIYIYILYKYTHTHTQQDELNQFQWAAVFADEVHKIKVCLQIRLSLNSC